MWHGDSKAVGQHNTADHSLAPGLHGQAHVGYRRWRHGHTCASALEALQFESARVSMVAVYNTGDPLMPTRQFSTSRRARWRPSIGHVFHQVDPYALDHNEPFADLVILTTCPENLEFTIPQRKQSVPIPIHNHTTSSCRRRHPTP